jgi:hypothetical protein
MSTNGASSSSSPKQRGAWSYWRAASILLLLGGFVYTNLCQVRVVQLSNAQQHPVQFNTVVVGDDANSTLHRNYQYNDNDWTFQGLAKDSCIYVEDICHSSHRWFYKRSNGNSSGTNKKYQPRLSLKMRHPDFANHATAYRSDYTFEHDAANTITDQCVDSPIHNHVRVCSCCGLLLPLREQSFVQVQRNLTMCVRSLSLAFALSLSLSIDGLVYHLQ